MQQTVGKTQQYKWPKNKMTTMRGKSVKTATNNDDWTATQKDKSVLTRIEFDLNWSKAGFKLD